ncbi:hypothetical protein KSF73_16335 [Burkholderiaceae bacterium DAT-1]|nr:hypothetical protein [Burkholderiaceae bacterium DAT-1]
MAKKTLQQEITALRAQFENNSRLRLEFLGQLSSLLRTHQIDISNELLRSLVLAIGDEKGSISGSPTPTPTPVNVPPIAAKSTSRKSPTPTPTPVNVPPVMARAAFGGPTPTPTPVNVPPVMLKAGGPTPTPTPTPVNVPPVALKAKAKSKAAKEDDGEKAKSKKPAAKPSTKKK